MPISLPSPWRTTRCAPPALTQAKAAGLARATWPDADDVEVAEGAKGADIVQPASTKRPP